MPDYYGSLTNQLGTTANTDSLLRWDHTLFDNFTVPVGMDRDTALAVIMRLHGLAPLYRPDPFWMKDAIKWWCKECLPIWEKLYSTTQLVYNPIWNTDVSERTTDVRTIDRDTTNDSTAIDRAKSKGTLGSLTTGDRHEVTEGTGHEETHGTSEGTSHEETHGTSEGTSHEETHATGEGTSHEDTHGTSDGKTHEETAGKSATDTTSSTNAVTDTTVDGTDSETTDSTKKLDQTVTRDISPENAPDYQPDDQTHTVADETLKTTTDGKHHETTNVVGNTTSTGNSTTNTNGTSDGTTHGETWGTEDGNTTSKSDSTTDGKTTDETWGTADGKTTGQTYGTTDSRTTGKADEVTKGTRQDETHEKSVRHADQKERGTEDVTETYNHGWIKQGNIGVTTTQQMIEAERETVLFDVYKVIADDYHAKFCLDVY